MCNAQCTGFKAKFQAFEKAVFFRDESVLKTLGAKIEQAKSLLGYGQAIAISSTVGFLVGFIAILLDNERLLPTIGHLAGLTALALALFSFGERLRKTGILRLDELLAGEEPEAAPAPVEAPAEAEVAQAAAPQPEAAPASSEG